MGVQVAVCTRDEEGLALSLCAGQMGPVDPRPVTTDTLFNAFSVTKAVTATAIHLVSFMCQDLCIDHDPTLPLEPI